VPLYDFLCQSCGAESELLVRGAATPVCPACGSESLDRLLSLPAVRSDATRDVVGRYAKKRDAAQAKDRIHEQAKYERNHD
jgi:putative FmdB family regulatory protein